MSRVYKINRMSYVETRNSEGIIWYIKTVIFLFFNHMGIQLPLSSLDFPYHSGVSVDRISHEELSTQIIFNCQMGRGRTTTGMVVATLIYFNRIGASGISRSISIGRVSDMNNGVDSLLSSEEAIPRGEYTVIRSLIRVLEGGVEGKRQVDKVIDRCASMQGYYRRGVAYLAMGKFKEALKDFQQVKRLCPNDPDAAKKLRECAKAVMKLKFEEAISVPEAERRSVADSIDYHSIGA